MGDTSQSLLKRQFTLTRKREKGKREISVQQQREVPKMPTPPLNGARETCSDSPDGGLRIHLSSGGSVECLARMQREAQVFAADPRRIQK